ncbi:hypothetical protein JD844_017063 [Phrynosoma platyrhinos]|uniref:Bicarbonate transporter-like transmembrane domain-containing protein n=1 Tax=Phrynosoma platyrhinos TaxID=52577 RepID=A0ABQ7SLD2_PHRPL|nr:hypothetical protein JD844_017063 [Phrynosoma platyrhinos]
METKENIPTDKPSTRKESELRRLVGDFSIILAILIFCGIDAAFGLETPKLIVPNEFKPTNPTRGWFVFPFGANPWWIYLASSVPAILVIILIFMDQQITAVILNRKEYKLQFIPMPVLYGIFLYMGVAALSSIQFTDRLQLLLMPAKHQPDFIYLRHVPLRQVHLFTFIQILCLAVLWIIKSTAAAIIFPLMFVLFIFLKQTTLLALVGVRKVMEYIFPRHYLVWLDDIMPEKERKEEEEKLKRKQDQDDSDSEDVSMILGDREDWGGGCTGRPVEKGQDRMAVYCLSTGSAMSPSIWKHTPGPCTPSSGNCCCCFQSEVVRHAGSIFARYYKYCKVGLGAGIEERKPSQCHPMVELLIKSSDSAVTIMNRKSTIPSLHYSRSTGTDETKPE